VPFKLYRVRHRVTPERLTGRRALSVAVAVTSLSALASGVWWAFGGQVRVGPWGLLMVHMALGVVVPLLLAWHLRHRFHSPTALDPDRRSALRYTAVVTGAALTWRGQRALNGLLETAGADRRFTGSREAGSGDGNAFPVTSWVADDPDRIDRDDWSLDVTGAVAESYSLSYGDLPTIETATDESTDPASTAAERAERRALLDCTSGWYSVHDWQGVRVGDLLNAVDPADSAAWVQFRSVTGYRWSLPIEEAHDALLATHVDNRRLSHGHGGPARLVAPGRRGFQWVKWVEEVRVTRRRELGESVAIFVSGLDG
jgi:hypothetical protein